jgi:hypothetical protein
VDDPLLQVFVRGEILDVREFPLPHGVDDVAFVGRFSALVLDDLQKIDDLVARQSVVKKGVSPSLEEERQALGQISSLKTGLPVGELILFDADLELIEFCQEGQKLLAPPQKVLDRDVVGG